MILLLLLLGSHVVESIEGTFHTKLTYQWYANVTAGSLLPTEHLSQYNIDAEIDVLINDTFYVFQINSRNTDSDMNTANDVFHLPFRVTYSDDHITFFKHEDDQVWSLNIKKSLASLFQVKKEALKPGAFETREENIYGNCDVEYITEENDFGLTVIKIMNEGSCSNSPSKRKSNTPYFTCPSSFQEGISNYNKRTYKYLSKDKSYISEIKSDGTIHFQPFQALAEAHYIKVSQSLNLIGYSNETTDTVAIELIDSLKTSINIAYTNDALYMSTFGHIENKTLLKSEIYHLLEVLSENLDWKLSTHNLDNQTSFHILELMWWLDVKDWEELYDMVSVGTSYSQETIRHFFWDFLPQVGSEASVIFIKKLVISRKISGFSAALLLTTFPLHLKNVSEKFLIESEDFLRLRDVDTETQNAGILSFAVLVERVCKNHCDKEVLDRYTKYYLDKFIETPNYQDQMVYLQAFSNMKLSRILDFLSPIAKNPSYDRHIRYLTIWCMMPTIEKHPARATEIFWPIFMNGTEALEIRVSALYILLITQPSASRLLTFFWHLKNEKNYHVYNFFYTTVHSFANTKYPCYKNIHQMASQLSRYLLPRAYRWATGNYIIDYEDTERGYGGLIQLFIVASESSGLPGTLILSTEQHSHGLSSKFSLHFKMEGVVNTIWQTLFDVTNFTSAFSTMDVKKLLKAARSPVKTPEVMHIELMVKMNGNTVYCKYFNETSFSSILAGLEEARSFYYDFSVNFQRVRFPLRYEVTKLSDLGTPVNLQIWTASILSTRGSIKQMERGARRDAELDFRYSMNTVTSLKTLNPFQKTWYGADRTRGLHIRIPVSTHLFEKQKSSFFEITADRHKAFINESTQGFVWHSTIKLSPPSQGSRIPNPNGNNEKHWLLESRDLGARFEAKVFDCNGDNNIKGSLHIMKEAFLLSNKNYKMVIGAVPILGFYSLANYFTFIPPGDSCGIIVSMTPLQVQLALVSEGRTFHVTLRTEREKSQIWDLIIKNRELDNDGLSRVDFKLNHPDVEDDLSLTNSSLRLLQLEGYLKSPSFRQGILNAPSPIEGQARLSWEQTKQNTSIELKLKSNNTELSWPVNCENDTASCLQVVSSLATQQTLSVNCINLPIWVTTALMSIFPDNVHAEKESTKIKFSLLTKLPWTTQGECVISHDKVLSFDNGTIESYLQNTDCYAVAVADCFLPSQFIIGVRKILSDSNTLEIKILASYTTLTISRTEGATNYFLINGTKTLVRNTYQFYPIETNNTNHIFQFKYWEQSKMTEVVVGQTGLIIQYYGESVAVIASFKLRGSMCGLCGDFNGEINNDGINSSYCIPDKDFHI